MKKIFAILISFAVLLSGCEKTAQKSENTEPSENSEKIIGVWINYNEIYDLISSCNNEEELNGKIKSMLNEFLKYRINTVFLHCRAFDDAFYNSAIYLPSEYCQNSLGELKFDVLKAFIINAKEYDIDIHAWINPYRIRKDGKVEKINDNSLAGKWYKENSQDQRLIITDNSIFYNPASQEIQKYILNGVREILDNYDIVGIHIDDYFYPTTSKSIDTEFFNEYADNGGVLNLSDFRRQCVNSLVSSMYSLVKSYGDDLIFSISPSANIEADYNSCYADVELWASEKGYADYIIPQIYFGFKHETMPFEKLLSEWANLKSDNVKIAVGIAVYKSGEVDYYAKSGKNEWTENSNILLNQINAIDSDGLNGYVYYSSKYLLNDYNEILAEEKKNILEKQK